MNKSGLLAIVISCVSLLSAPIAVFATPICEKLASGKINRFIGDDSNQEINCEKPLVSVDFEKVDKKTISFDLDNYDSSVALTIDPFLSFSSYFGTPDFDDIWDSAIDGDGNIYVTGGIGSSVRNAFIAKIDPDASSIIYVTIIGGSGDDVGLGIDVDSNGYAFVTGASSSFDFPVTPGAYIDPDASDARGAFIIKLSPDGSTLGYATTLGSTFSRGLDVAVDSSGSAYLTGESGTLGFPSTQGAFGACPTFTARAFVAKMSPDGSDLDFSGCIEATYGTGNSIAIDAARNVYIGGNTMDPLFPTTPGAYDTACPAPCNKGFVTKINSQGTAIISSTFFGGNSSFDNIQGIALDCSGSIHITGQTKSDDLPVTPGLFGPNEWIGTTGDAFAAKLSANGEQLIYSTYLGSKGFDSGHDIDASCDGKSYITGDAHSWHDEDPSPFPVTSDAFWVPQGSGANVFVSVIASAGDKLIFSTMLGGGGTDVGHGISVDSAGNIFVAGDTGSDDFPLASPVQDEIAGVSGFDGFISVISFNDSDGDGIENTSDNCMMHPNTDQRDTDGDGHGNMCDGDFDNDCVTAFLDLSIFKGGFFGTDPELDLDSDGVVAFLDLSIFKGLFFGTPGPSACGACPCPSE